MLETPNNKELYIPKIKLWLDSLTPRRFGFVSHAHADHFTKHDTILCTPLTAAIIKSRYGVGKKSIQTLEYAKTLQRGHFSIELLPAGHIAGSAMIHITDHETNSTLLYTGDFKTRSSYTSEEIQYKQADHLIMESTFGRPHYVMPPSADAERQLIEFVDNCLASGHTPILLAYGLGKAQEAHYILGKHNITPVLHHSVAKMSSVCMRQRMNLPDYRLIDELCPERHCIIMPPGVRKSPWISQVGKHKTAMLTGWALDNPIPWRYNDIDTLIPLSDHADYPNLVEFVEKIQPKTITTVHGSTKEFAADLRKKGYDAWSIDGSDQIDLI